MNVEVMMDEVITKLVNDHALATEKLIANQLVTVIKQMIQSGDIQRYIMREPMGEESQALSYIPYRGMDVLKTENDQLRTALEKIKSHGCCVMHNDSGCPGCTASDALK